MTRLKVSIITPAILVFFIGSINVSEAFFEVIKPLALVVGTALICYILFGLSRTMLLDGISQQIKSYLFRKIRLIPAVERELQLQISKAKEHIEADLQRLYTLQGKESPDYCLQLPCQGLTPEIILRKVEENMTLGKYDWGTGHVSGTVYHGGEELTELTSKVLSMTLWTNPIHLDVFPGVCKMEAEVVRMVTELFHGNQHTCGTLTSGGTESIILAVKAYRDYAVQVRGITNPEILVPKTAHAAFDKAAGLLNIRIRHVPIHQTTTKVKLEVLESMITKNTCMLVGSTPGYPYGVMDDIEGIGKIGLQHNIPVHVDACLGGFLLAFMPKCGFEIPKFDLAVEGVTSISTDTHKYGFAPKGTSVLLFSNKKFKHRQYFVQTNWPGGMYATATLAGSRPGALIAGCWSSLLYFGFDGYVEMTRKIVSAARRIEAGLRNISGIYIFGEPQVSVVAIGSDVFDIYRLADILNNKGWNLNNLQFPSGIHICVTYRHTLEGVVEQFLKDVADGVNVIMQNPQDKVSGAIAIYATSQKIHDRSIVDGIIEIYMDSCYNTTPCANSIVENVQTVSDHQKTSETKLLPLEIASVDKSCNELISTPTDLSCR